MTVAQGFWQRRLAGVRAEQMPAPVTDVPPKAAPQTDALPAGAEAQSDAEILAALDLPDPDTLVAGDDFSAFMSRAVPVHLRNRALRKLWRSNPVLACVDGLNDYDGDFLTGSTGNGVLQTTYQVGKGLLAHVQEMERQARARADATDPQSPAKVAEVAEAAETNSQTIPSDDPAPAAYAAAAGQMTDTPDLAEATGNARADAGDELAATQAAPTAPPRRMQFRFTETTA